MGTDNKTLAVDVLAVMLDDAQKAKRHRMTVDAEYADDAEEESKAARAAVAELIEAADVLHMLGVSKEEFPDWPDGWDWVRINAALARVKGESA